MLISRYRVLGFVGKREDEGTSRPLKNCTAACFLSVAHPLMMSNDLISGVLLGVHF
jgi:F0F1-type ATP synthase assembly protein I